MLGVPVEWCKDMHYGMPCAIRLGDGVWWVDNDASLSVWKQYADVWNNPPKPPKPQPVRGVHGPSSSDRLFALLDAAGGRRRGTSPPDDAPTEGLP